MKQVALVLMLCLFANLGHAQPVVGEFTAQFTTTELLSEQGAGVYAPIIKENKPIRWNVYVSPNYSPSKPPGLLVYVSPTVSGEIPKQWINVMVQHNLIWIAARQSGNNIKVDRRMAYALLATEVIRRDYKIDPKRVYLSGFSGGGRVASMLATQYPTLFKGGIYNCGANFWGKSNTPPHINTIKQNRYVFITGKNDFNLQDTQQVFRAYQRAGVKNSQLSVSPHMGHSNPNKKLFSEAISYLDQQE